MLKRYEYWSKNGKKWTSWFEYNSTVKDIWQFKNRLLNEYKDDK